MAHTDFKSVSDYIASKPKEVRPILERVRGIIRKAVPDADEVISYQIAAYKLSGVAVLFFAAWKEHYSLYPANEELVAKFKKELAPYEANEKGTIRFPLDAPIPAKLITDIAKFRVTQVAEVVLERAAKKKGAAKKAVAKKAATKKKAKKKPVAKKKTRAIRA